MPETAAHQLNRPRLVFAAACIGMLLFGVTLTTLGATLAPLMDRREMSRTDAGSLLGLMSLGILAGSLVFGPIVDRFGYRPILVIGALLALLGLEAIAFVLEPWTLRAAILAFGVGGGLLNGSTNALVSDISEDGRGSGLSLLGVFFGLGAFGVPFILGLLIGRVDYAAILAAAGGLVTLPLLYFVLIPFPTPKQPQGFPLAQAGRLLGDPVLLLFGTILFFQSGVEITVGGWSGRYAREELQLDEGRAVLTLSVFWLGMIAARLLLTALLARYSPTRLLVVFLAIAAVGSLLLLGVPGVASAVPGLFLLGFGLAATFPVVLGLLGGRHPELTGTAFSIAFVMALTGGSLLPYLTGALGDRVGLRASLAIVPAALGAMGILLAIVHPRLSSPRNP